MDAEVEPRYTLVEAQREFIRQDCVRTGHPVVDNRDKVLGAGWARMLTSASPGELTYRGPDAVNRGALECRCGAYIWTPRKVEE